MAKEQKPRKEDLNESLQKSAKGSVVPGQKSRSAQRYAGVTPANQVIQKRSNGAASSEGDVHGIAQEGVSGSGSSLPYSDKVQSSFGRFDISRISAHLDSDATKANNSLGAEAYATGDQIAFSKTPDLHTVAHEAAHVIQQRSGVQLKGGVGQEGDLYERNADEVADRVVQGKSAEDLLGGPSGQSGADASVQKKSIQFTGHPLDAALPAGAETPAHAGGRDATAQRRYSPEQYIKMWETEHGRKMTDEEKKTLERGCIGITVVNLGGSGNPPLDMAYGTFEQAWAEIVKLRAEFDKHPDMPSPLGGTLKDWKPVLFSKMFWSNQKAYDPNKVAPDAGKSDRENWEENVKGNIEDWHNSDDTAFLPDPKTGKVDMSDYKYRGRPKDPSKTTFNAAGDIDTPMYVNFDYAFWDESTNTFWHANHAEPGMQVYQSTRAKFEKGYVDFDRTIYCVGFAKAWDPKTAAGSH